MKLVDEKNHSEVIKNKSREQLAYTRIFLSSEIKELGEKVAQIQAQIENGMNLLAALDTAEHNMSGNPYYANTLAGYSNTNLMNGASPKHYAIDLNGLDIPNFEVSPQLQGGVLEHHTCNCGNAWNVSRKPQRQL